MKITQEMRSNGVPKDFKQGDENQTDNATTDLTASEKHLTGGLNGASNGNITPEDLLTAISLEWKSEMERIQALGLNGYKRKKESKSECLVQSGHAEIEGDTLLYIYGNALEVLGKPEFQRSVEQISFKYVRFDNIIHP